MRICLLASGSKGNALYVESQSSRILIDAGLSAREIAVRLASIEVEPASLDALLVSHEHHDHCVGLGPMARRYRLPVYIHPETRQALPRLGRIETLHEFQTDEVLQLGAFRIEPFPVTHDAVAPVGFLLDCPEGRIGVATDLGIATRLVRERLRGCRALVLEFNHDEQLLRDGPYPWPVKQRIASNFGHLSNGDSAALLSELLWEGLEVVFLAHLSDTNNERELAHAIASDALAGSPGGQPQLILGSQDRPSLCFAV